MVTKQDEEWLLSYRPVRGIPADAYTVVQISEPDSRVEKIVLKPNPMEPQNFEDFIGQNSQKEVLQIVVDSANVENRLIPCVMLTGPYGHGKTTLAKLAVRRHKKKVVIIDGAIAGNTIESSDDTIYIVDEAHNIPAQVADSYNILIDSNQLRIIACTTNPGALPAPFRSRFRNIYLTSYNEGDIAEIVTRAARRLKCRIIPSAAQIIGERSKLNPRVALNLLEFTREMSLLNGINRLGVKDIENSLSKLDIDTLGLNSIDRKYLSLISSNPVGLNYISSALSIDTATIQQDIEPYLIQLGLIERTSKGRVAGTAAKLKASREIIEKRLRINDL